MGIAQREGGAFSNTLGVYRLKSGSTGQSQPDPMLPTIADGHVTLRPWRTSDAELLHQAMQDADTVRWMAIDLPYTLEDARGL